MKRWLSMLLCVAMLTPYVQSAGDNTQIAGVGGYSPGFSTSQGGKQRSKYPSPTDPNGAGAGLMLSVETLPVDITYTLKDGKRDVNTEQYKKVVEHFTKWLPSTNPTTGIIGAYLLPTSAHKDSVRVIVGTNGHQINTIPGKLIMGSVSNGKLKNTGGLAAWAEASKGLTNTSKLTLSLPSGYWQNYISKIAGNGSAAKRVVQLFSSDEQSNGYSDTNQIEDLNTRILYYLGSDKNDTNPNTFPNLGRENEQYRDTARFFNYCSLLADVIAVHPTSRTGLAKQLDTMCQNYLSGSAWRPMVVTGELLVSTANAWNSNTRSTWWSPKQAMQAHTLHMTIDMSKVQGMSGNVIDNIAKTHKANQDTSLRGGLNMFGVWTKDGFRQYKSGSVTWPVVGRLITSVNSAVLQKYGIQRQPIEGFGVWGLAEAPPVAEAPPPPLVTNADVTAMGTVGVTVEKPSYVKEPGAYSETFTATVTLNLGASYTETTGDKESKRGNGFANVLLWLAEKRADGHSFPDPSIRVYLKPSEAAPAISQDAAAALIDDTRGYAQDGNNPDTNYKGVTVTPAELEERAGLNATWTGPALYGRLVLKDPGIEGIKIEPGDSNGIKITITDLAKAYEYFQKNNDSLVFVGEFAGNGNLEDDSSMNMHWFKVGADVDLFGPASLSDMNSLAKTNVGLETWDKYAYTIISTKPEEKPYYYSIYQTPYSELKQGTVPVSGGGSSEKFNSMTGTPTFTDTGTRVDFQGTPYENAGRYYQYFASGGSEFIVQFDGEYVDSANTSRTYTATFSPVACDMNNGSCHTEPTPKGGSRHVEDKAHCTHNYHDVGDTFTWSQAVNGFSYVKITNLKVWRLSEAKLDGTRELLDTDEVTATVQSVAPSISYNIAASDTATAGRVVYTYETKQKDTVTIPGYPKPSNNSHANHRAINQKTLDASTASIKCGATCVSDFIVLRTSNGDQSVLYYEYKSKNEAHINTGNCVAEPIEFDKVPYETIWTNNSKTSAGSNLPDDGITYGGYNGNYRSVDTKYQSSGHASNIDFNSTIVYQNKGVMAGSWSAVTDKATTKFRLMNDKLIIPDTKQNGEYIVGESKVFYENVVNFGNKVPTYPVTSQSDFGGKNGFVLTSTYSDGHDKINDVVVYNPVSNQNAIVVSLPKERDQRIKELTQVKVQKAFTCPGDASCEHLVNECTITNHIHTENCYQLVSYDVHTGNNAHEHTADCPKQEVPRPPSNITRRVNGREDYAFIANASGAISFHADNSDRYPRVRVSIGGLKVAENKPSVVWSYTDIGSVRFDAGDHVRVEIYHFGIAEGAQGTLIIAYDGNGAGGSVDTQYTCNDLPLNKHVCTSDCYVIYKSLLKCNDPHHAYSYNWRLYTYGLKHVSGAVCTGRSCADTSAIVFPTQQQYTPAQCEAGQIVRHANGDVHVSTTADTCSYCGNSYKELLSAAQSADRVPVESEYSCYTYGDSRCWAPCRNDANHQRVVTEVTDTGGKTYKMGDFINLDYPFTIYFPNTGDFYGTGAKWSSATSPERGHGYVNNMDTTEWVQKKWVEFPFAVVYANTTYLANERIYLSVPQTTFEFYVPLHDSEAATAEVKFGTVAINTQNGEEIECGTDASQNLANITYNGKPMSHHHNADKRTYIDVVGRIGNLTLNDTGDFRYSNLFKVPRNDWLVKNIVKKVDATKQNYIMVDSVDVRGVHVANTGVAGNTHNTRPERGTVDKLIPFPLTPAKNNISALTRQPIRIGYDSYFDLTTLGNYYGNKIYNEDGSVARTNLILIKPHYYRLDLDTGDYKPVDVYMNVNGTRVLVNDSNSNTVAYNGADSKVNLNWVDEKDRRNFAGVEVTNSKAVADATPWVELPTGSSWVYGNYNILNLTQRNRTFVGSEYTYKNKEGWTAHKDPSNRLADVLASFQGQRWHFNVGLPSSAVFVYSGQEPTQANIDACSGGNAVVFCALEIYAQGEVWTLAYDGSHVNAPFKVTENGKTFDPVVPYPPGKSPKGEEMPIVEIISINHSSREDLNTSGTH